VLNDPASAFQTGWWTAGLFQSVSGYYLTLDHTGRFTSWEDDAGAHAGRAADAAETSSTISTPSKGSRRGPGDRQKHRESPWRSPPSRSRCSRRAGGLVGQRRPGYTRIRRPLGRAEAGGSARVRAHLHRRLNPGSSACSPPRPPRTRSPRGCVSAEADRSVSRRVRLRAAWLGALHAAASHGGGRPGRRSGGIIRRHPD